LVGHAKSTIVWYISTLVRYISRRLTTEGASDDKRDEPPQLPSNTPVNGKILAYQQHFELKNTKTRKRKQKRKRSKKKEKRKKREIKKTTSYRKEQEWKLAI
jgi:hypothetical protein